MSMRSTPAEQTLPARADRKRQAAALRDSRAAQLRAEADAHTNRSAKTKKRQAAARCEADAIRLRAEADAYDALWSMFQAGMARGRAEQDGPILVSDPGQAAS